MKRGNTTLLHISIVLFSLFLVSVNLSAAPKYVISKAKAGDGITILLNRFFLPVNSTNISLFKELNKNKFDKRGGLLKGYRYNLPIEKIIWNQKSISSSIPLADTSFVKAVIHYNQKVVNARLKAGYKIDGYIWVPLYLISNTKIVKKTKKKKKPTTIVEPLFGKKYQKVKIKNRKLDGYIFYLISGHGGPDPGAMTHKNGHELTEDEYGYDIILRLAHNLIGNGAKTFLIVQDSADGIRDDYYLKNNSNEIYYGNDTISHFQKIRLTKRADIVNNISKKYPHNKQFAVIIHVDSRHTKKRIDIFFYYQDGNKISKALASTMYKTIKRKYQQKQPGRGYEGTVKTRNLFMLRNLNIPTVYIELGNIQNPLDQVRILNPNNRQAIANWLRDGIINYLKK